MENDINKLKYMDEEMFVVIYNYLIINVKSINDKFGPINDFVTKYKLDGETNGKLFTMGEFGIPQDLPKIINKILKPLGLREKKDFVLTFDRYDDPDFVGKELPECTNVEWLGSFVHRTGMNLVWFMPLYSWLDNDN
jgi:hypothetical protein